MKNIKLATTATKKVLGFYYKVRSIFLIVGIWFTFKFLINVKILIIINYEKNIYKN